MRRRQFREQNRHRDDQPNLHGVCDRHVFGGGQLRCLLGVDALRARHLCRHGGLADGQSRVHAVREWHLLGVFECDDLHGVVFVRSRHLREHRGIGDVKRRVHSLRRQ
jgi:hypothetical protein